jgi:tetratricopeptide (TPR) repeat protein
MTMKKIYTLFFAMSFGSVAIFAQPSFTWAKSMGQATDDRGYSVEVDASGNVYSTGYFQGTVDFDPGAGTFNMTSFGAQDIFISKLDASGNFVWAKQLGGTGSDYGYAIALDGSGNVFTTGMFASTADFDPSGSAFNMTIFGGVWDIFVSKLDPSGNFVWAKQLGGNGQDNGQSIKVDGSGNVFIGGMFSTGLADFDPGAGTYTLNCIGNTDAYVCKLNSSGNFVFAKQIGACMTSTASVQCKSIKLDGSGNIYSTGFIDGSGDFDPGAGTFNITGGAGGAWDIYVSKLDVSGNFVFAKQLGAGGSGQDYGSSVALDGSGNIYTVGYFGSTGDFDPNAGTFNMTSLGGNDIFISKLDVSGNFVYAKQIGDVGNDIGYSVSFDACDNLYMTGLYNATVDFDPNAGTSNLTSIGGSDIFILKLNALGNFLWAGSIGGATNDLGKEILISNNYVYTTGWFQGTADFNAGAGVSNLTSVGNNDIFITKYCAGIPNQPSAINGSTSVCISTANSYSTPSLCNAISYTWILPGGWSGSSSSNAISATSGSSGVFTITASNACGVSPQQTLNIIVNSLPTITANTSNSIICGPPYQGFCNLYTETNQFAKALKFQDKVFAIAKAGNDKKALMQAYISYAVAYLKQKNYPLAENNFKNALSMAEEIKDTYFISFIKERLYLVYDANGDYKNALLFYKQYNEETRKQNDVEIQSRINDLETKYSSEKKEKEIVLLKQKEITANALSERRKSYTIIALVSCLLLLTLLLLFILRHRHRKKQLVLELERNSAIFEQQALRAQMNPHFIFNALNSIQHYILGNETQYAYDYLAKFSKLIRQVLTNSQRNEISLKDELDMLKLYIELENRRFADRFDYKINCADEIHIEDIKIPVMIIQPFVENAVWHGIMNLDKSNKGFVSVTFEVNNKQLKISIQDNGLPDIHFLLVRNLSSPLFVVRQVQIHDLYKAKCL